ncbi:MAG: hypothetical protein RI955_1678, partial [Bacteroidota bacterium]
APNRYGSTNRKNVWYYQNSSVASQQPFNFRSDSFLVSEMIDVGANSFPTFFDYDNDGLNDLIISSGGTLDTAVHNSYAQLFLYKNTGTTNAARFQLVSNNWLNISSLLQPSLAPTFGDIDGDGLKDMLCGLINGNILFLKNTGTISNPQFVLQSSTYQNIDVGDYAAPQLFDVNNDGLLDLAIGNMLGNISYYKNIGTKNSPSFTLITSNFGGVDVKENGDVTGFAAPCFFRFTNTSPLSLLVGNAKGHLFQYDNISSNLLGNFTLTTNYFSQINCGEFATPTVNQLVGNDSVEIVCGTSRGGLQMYSNGGVPFVSRDEISSVKNGLTIYPNPAEEWIVVSLKSLVNTIEILDVLGRVMLRNEASNQQINKLSTQQLKLDVSALPNGIYFIKITDEKGNVVNGKFVKE